MADLKSSFLAPSRPQTTSTPQSRGLAPKSIVSGSPTAAGSKNANPSADSGNPLGVGSLGDGRKPFKLSGG
jgi:hypothetical protein